MVRQSNQRTLVGGRTVVVASVWLVAAVMMVLSVDEDDDVTRVERQQWWCRWRYKGGSGGWVVVEGWVARDCEWVWGSDQSGDGDHFWIRPEKSAGKICNILICMNLDHLNKLLLIGIPDEVMSNLNVLSLGHNLFSVGQFCDGDLEVAFRSNTCYVRNLEGDDLLTGGRDSNLYTISISDMAASSPVCLMSKATSTKSWLRHRRLSHLNFGIINNLTRLDLVDGLPKFKYGKDHLCSACYMGQSKISFSSPNLVPVIIPNLELLHMELCVK
ncbi:integrase, catalytic region, zinc finger, CCHC-type containing protein [Tanacetum coccineum]|uniref:Integrase, catalytic region, zinc finger, CCHC-type containing protein n=1 Tax=Tanacetum coccineum TaxID=301880 RepID=A0ABQ4ZUG6_9ASTR